MYVRVFVDDARFGSYAASYTSSKPSAGAIGGRLKRGRFAKRVSKAAAVYLAAAKYRPSLVLLMDEVDAALDEHNTQRVAAMLKEVARTSQVVAISHHKEFHELADHMVHLSKASDHTVVR